MRIVDILFLHGKRNADAHLRQKRYISYYMSLNLSMPIYSWRLKNSEMTLLTHP
jgi:hypothetical protein